MRKLRISAMVLLASTLAGCVTFSNVEPSTGLSLGPDEGLVIIGAPPGAKLVFHSGDLKDDKFVSDGWMPDGIVGTAENGYLIRKLKASSTGRAYGLFHIHTDRYYAAGCNQMLPTFTVQAGQIQYLGDFTFSNTLEGITFQFDHDSAKAIANFASLFPGNTVPVTDDNMQFVPQGRCKQTGGTTYIPVIVHSRK